jgi:hypothetical protein
MPLKFLLCETHNQQDNFNYIDWQALKARVSSPAPLNNLPPEVAKKLSPAISASDAPCKTIEAIKKHDCFTLLRLDLDNTPFDIKTVQKLLISLCIDSFIIHTTASHTQENKRYRVYIELKHALNLKDWQMIESYLSYKFSADDCASRPQQIMYLPIDTPGYEYIIQDGDSFGFDNAQIFKQAIAFNDHQLRLIESIKGKQAKPARPQALIGAQVSIIDAVNSHFSWNTLLAGSGYRKQGKAWACPESTSKTAGVFILTGADGKERYYSHHESDPCGTGFAIDKFDFICIRQYSDNTSKAIKEIAAEYFPDLDKHNKRVYMQLNRVKGRGVANA